MQVLAIYRFLASFLETNLLATAYGDLQASASCSSNSWNRWPASATACLPNSARGSVARGSGRPERQAATACCARCCLSCRRYGSCLLRRAGGAR